MTGVEVLSKTEVAATPVDYPDIDDCVYQSAGIKMRELVVYGGSSNPALVQEICKSLSIKEGAINLGKFSNGETSVAIDDSVREKDVYIVQSGCGHVNDNLTELLITISACKMASAARVTAVVPLFPYSRQPDYPYNKKGAPLRNGAPRDNYTFESIPGTPKREHSFESNISVPLNKSIAKSLFDSFETTKGKTKEDEIAWPASEIQSNAGYKEWVAQAGTLVADLLTCAGADHIITMDLHDPQFQGFFDVPVDNLYSKPLLQRYIVTHVKDFRQAVIVSPDAGGAKRATAIADTLGMDFALIHKERRPQRTSGRIVAPMMLVGAVSGRDAVLVDDLCDTSNTVTRAAKLLKDRGANYVYVLVTHGIFSGDALKRIKASAIDKIVTTNSVPQDAAKAELGDRLHILDVGPIFGEAIRRIHNGESVSMLFDLGI